MGFTTFSFCYGNQKLDTEMKRVLDTSAQLVNCMERMKKFRSELEDS